MDKKIFQNLSEKELMQRKESIYRYTIF